MQCSYQLKLRAFRNIRGTMHESCIVSLIFLKAAEQLDDGALSGISDIKKTIIATVFVHCEHNCHLSF